MFDLANSTDWFFHISIAFAASQAMNSNSVWHKWWQIFMTSVHSQSYISHSMKWILSTLYNRMLFSMVFVENKFNWLQSHPRLAKNIAPDGGLGGDVLVNEASVLQSIKPDKYCLHCDFSRSLLRRGKIVTNQQGSIMGAVTAFLDPHRVQYFLLTQGSLHSLMNWFKLNMKTQSVLLCMYISEMGTSVGLLLVVLYWQHAKWATKSRVSVFLGNCKLFFRAAF